MCRLCRSSAHVVDCGSVAGAVVVWISNVPSWSGWQKPQSVCRIGMNGVANVQSSSAVPSGRILAMVWIVW